MIIPQLLDLSTTVSKLLIYFNINHVNDAPARQPSTSPSAFYEPPTLLRTPVPLLRLVAPGKQEMSISIKIDRHNYRWLPAPKFLGGVSDAHPLNFANEPGNLNPLFLSFRLTSQFILISPIGAWQSCIKDKNIKRISLVVLNQNLFLRHSHVSDTFRYTSFTQLTFHLKLKKKFAIFLFLKEYKILIKTQRYLKI